MVSQVYFAPSARHLLASAVLLPLFSPGSPGSPGSPPPPEETRAASDCVRRAEKKASPRACKKGLWMLFCPLFHRQLSDLYLQIALNVSAHKVR